MNFLSSLFLTINSLSISFILFLFKNEKSIIPIDVVLDNKTEYSILLVVITIIIFHFIGNQLIKSDESEQIERGSIENIDYANYLFLPSFLSYFFIAMSVDTYPEYFFVFTMLVLFLFRTKLFYFNPIYLLCGYNFFYLTYKDKVKILVITKQELKDPADISFEHLKRINNYTYFDSE